MNAAYRNAIRDHGKTLVTHIGLIDDTDTELTDGSPAYARKAVTWEDDGDGVMRPNANIEFDIPADTTVKGWRGYDQLEAGGTDYGGANFATTETFASQGTLTLIAATSGVLHNAG